MGWGSPHTPTCLPLVPTAQLSLLALLCTVATFWVTFAGVCLAHWLCRPLPGIDHSVPLPTASPASKPAWHQGGDSTFWKVMPDLFRGRGGHRSMCRSHPRASAWSARVSAAHSHLCQLQRDTDASPASPTAGLGSVNYFHLISSRSSAYPFPGPPPPASPHAARRGCSGARE